MDADGIAYRGYVITQSLDVSDAPGGRVRLESRNPHLFNRLLGQYVSDDPRGIERAVMDAKQYIDAVLGSSSVKKRRPLKPASGKAKTADTIRLGIVLQGDFLGDHLEACQFGCAEACRDRNVRGISSPGD
jgi:hypothetical protein